MFYRLLAALGLLFLSAPALGQSLYTQPAQPAMAASIPCSSADPAYAKLAQRYTQGILFRLELCGQKTHYMLGTMHSDDPSLHAILEPVRNVIPHVQVMAFEVLADADTAQIAQTMMFERAEKTTRLQQLLTAQQAAILEAALQQRAGLSTEIIGRLKPWSAAVLLQYPPKTADGVVLDERLQQIAATAGLKTVALERATDQFRIFDNIPQNRQQQMLKDTIDGLNESDRINALFLRTYSNRDLREMTALAEESFALTTDLALQRYLREELLTKRNRNMVERLKPLLPHNSILTAIGALHLLGDDGMLTLLEQQGYAVYPVY